MSKIEDQKNQDMSNSPDNLSRSTSFVDDRASVGSHDPEDQEIDHRFSVEIPTGDEVIPGKKSKIYKKYTKSEIWKGPDQMPKIYKKYI